VGWLAVSPTHVESHHGPGERPGGRLDGEIEVSTHSPATVILDAALTVPRQLRLERRPRPELVSRPAEECRGVAGANRLKALEAGLEELFGESASPGV
jgi:hypothetical protein